MTTSELIRLLGTQSPDAIVHISEGGELRLLNGVQFTSSTLNAATLNTRDIEDDDGVYTVRPKRGHLICVVPS